MRQQFSAQRLSFVLLFFCCCFALCHRKQLESRHSRDLMRLLFGSGIDSVHWTDSPLFKCCTHTHTHISITFDCTVVAQKFYRKNWYVRCCRRMAFDSSSYSKQGEAVNAIMNEAYFGFHRKYSATNWWNLLICENLRFIASWWWKVRYECEQMPHLFEHNEQTPHHVVRKFI